MWRQWLKFSLFIYIGVIMETWKVVSSVEYTAGFALLPNISITANVTSTMVGASPCFCRNRCLVDPSCMAVAVRNKTQGLVECSFTKTALHTRTPHLLKDTDSYVYARKARKLNFKTLKGESGSTSYFKNQYNHEKAFLTTADGSQFWHNQGAQGNFPETIWYKFKDPVNINMFSFQSRGTGGLSAQDGPTRYEFFGVEGENCENQNKWTTLLKDVSGTPFTDDNKPKVGSVENTDSFNCYGFKVEDVKGRSNGNKYITMANINFYQGNEIDICKDQFVYLREAKSPSYIGTAGSTTDFNVDHQADRAFVDNPTIGWCSANSRMPEAIWKQFEEPLKVYNISFQGRQNLDHDVPTKFDVFGSNDADCANEASWEILASDDSGERYSIKETKTIHIPTSLTRGFMCYGIRVRDVPARSNGNKYACLSHFKFYVDAGVDFTSANGQPQASSQSSNTEPKNAFDHNTPDQEWCSEPSSNLPQSLWYEFPQPVTVIKYSFKAKDTAALPMVPIKYQIFASNNLDCSDKSSWVILKEVDIGARSVEASVEEQLENNKTFSCYGFHIRDVAGGVSGIKSACLSDVHLFLDSICP